MAQKHHLILTLIIHGAGSHKQAWKTLPDRDAFLSLDHYLEVARIAHRGTFDALWLPDIPMTISPPEHTPYHSVDPTLLMTAIAAQVPDIGVVPTISTTYSHPFTTARNIATLNVLSGGRGGINAIMSYADRAAQNYGDPGIETYDQRQRRAHEFLEVYRQLGASWTLADDGAWQDKGYLFDPALRREVNFNGEFYQVRGPLNVPQARSGRPLLSVAGGSEQSLDLAARHADVLYAALVHKGAAQDLVRDLHTRVQKFGRRPGSLKVMPGLVPVIGSTEDEAQRKLERLALEGGYATDPVQRISDLLGFDPATLHPDRPLTEEQLQLPTSWKRPVGLFHSVADVARRDNLTVRELARVFQLDIGHRLVVGTPASVAEQLLDWWRDDACHGFAVRAQHLPEDAELLSDEVIPLLRKAGAFPDGYAKESLRERFGVADEDPLPNALAG